MSDIGSDALENRATVEIGYEDGSGMFAIGLQQLLGAHQFVGDFEEDQDKIYADEIMTKVSILSQDRSYFQLVDKMEIDEGQPLVDWKVFGNIILQFVEERLEYKVHIYTMRLMEQALAGHLDEALPDPVKIGVLKKGMEEKIVFTDEDVALGEGPINTPWWILIKFLR
jgi:hypothetical protein